MDASAILFYGVVALVLAVYLRRWLVLRSVKQYSPAELHEKMQRNALVLLDVRTNAERGRSAIRGSTHIPLHELRRRLDELGRYKDKEIVCYCATGNRSLAAAAKLKKLGFNVGNLKGGIAEWKFSGLS